jgi:hypothetical protein
LWPKLFATAALILLIMVPYCGWITLHDRVGHNKPPLKIRVTEVFLGLLAVAYTAAVVGILIATIVGAIPGWILTLSLMIYVISAATLWQIAESDD